MQKTTNKYIYTYAYRKEENSLCELELRAFFNTDFIEDSSVIVSNILVNPSRSTFLRDRMDVMFEGDSLQEIVDQVRRINVTPLTYKVLYLKGEDEGLEKITLSERRRIEREVGLQIEGEPDLLKPDKLFAVIIVNGRWYFGDYEKSEAVWLHHQKKPNDYSTALNTRMARAIANIAVPFPEGIKAIDPCCGIGTVLVEALSMGINIVGSDVNPLVLTGARENIAHFGYTCEVKKRDIRDVVNRYDVAIIDLPYNLCSVITQEQQLEMLQCAHRIADKLVLVTIETIDDVIEDAGFTIHDRCEVKKGKLLRQIIVCTKD
ncbi:TRM11 family SAM-dependent methyltransferase [Bacillus pinisoli]|uniref:TRM11 family SAM-dependent methyltransferase n=1 Tax=Bacillus pinisoli TaxID=2901866 RepID=UPI001FF53BD5|nr:methyltransferase domain-containing protein [Bacillus pinisoli]